MRWEGFFSILFLAGLTALAWKINRHYMRSGIIFGVPFSIYRSRTPRLFKGVMILGWLSFALMVLFSVTLSVAIIHSSL